MTLGGSCYLYSHFWEANSILMSDSFSRLARFVVRSPSWRRPIASSSHRGKDARMGRWGLQFRHKDNALFCNNKIKTELFSLICNIFLYSCLFVWYGVCERHPEGKNTASPCRNIFHAMRL